MFDPTEFEPTEFETGGPRVIRPKHDRYTRNDRAPVTKGYSK